MTSVRPADLSVDVKNVNKSKKFVYVSSPVSSSFGGGERFLDLFTSYFSEVEHVFLGSSRAIYELFVKKGYQAILSTAGWEPVTLANCSLLPLSYAMGAWQFFSHKRLFQDADLIISPTSFCEAFFLSPWLKKNGKKLLYMVHSNKVPNAFIKTPLGKILAQSWKHDPVVFVSNTQRSDWEKHRLGVKNAITQHNGVQIHSFDPGLSARGSAVPVRFGFLSRLHWEKGLDVLLRALPLLRTSGTPIRIVIGGEGPCESEYRRILEGLSLPSNISVEWFGFVSDTKKFLESIDALVFPSRREAFSLVLLEAWERGIPVITSNIPAFLEAKAKASDRERELICATDDPADLATKLDGFMKHRSVYTGKAHRAELHQVVVENFDLEKVLAAYRAVIDKILETQIPSTLAGRPL